jgi:hypothetical protein
VLEWYYDQITSPQALLESLTEGRKPWVTRNSERSLNMIRLMKMRRSSWQSGAT